MTAHEAGKGNMPRYCKTGKSVQTSLRGIENKATEKPDQKFRNLHGMLDKELLTLAYRQLNKKAAAGIDQVTYQEYGRNLDGNLDDLIDRLKRGGYRARLVKRKTIPKGNGKTRDLGIPTLEDRLLQKAVAMILEAIYEPTFRDCSYGYRRGKGAKAAVSNFRDALNFGDYHYVVEADIKGFFDHLDHEKLIEMMEERVEDRKLIRLIRKWLKAGILDPEGMVINPLTGTPQGGIISPILANIYLHYALDLWIEVSVKRQIKGELKYVRYADDFVCAFSLEEDAERFHRKLAERLDKFGLEVAEEKTNIICFSRCAGPDSKRFDFLGFELFWGKGRRGTANLKRRTSPKRKRRAIRETKEWIKANRSLKLNELIDQLNAKLRGHYQYYGVIGNSGGIGSFFFEVCKSLHKWLNRRSQKKSMTWIEFGNRVRKRLLSPRIMEQRIQQLSLFHIRG